MTSPIALALLINHEARTTFALDRDRPSPVAAVDPAPSLLARIVGRLGRRRSNTAGAPA